MYQSSTCKRFFEMLRSFDDLDGANGTRERDEIRENDVLFIDTKSTDYDGQICIVKVKGAEKSIYQRVYRAEQTITLCCPTDGDITGVYPLEDVTIRGKITGLYRPLPVVDIVKLDEYEKLFETIQTAKPGKYDIKLNEIKAIAAKEKGGAFGCIIHAFLYGFAKGQRAEKARAKKARLAKRKEAAQNGEAQS